MRWFRQMDASQGVCGVLGLFPVLGPGTAILLRLGSGVWC
jgi:hypothetical protein